MSEGSSRALWWPWIALLAVVGSSLVFGAVRARPPATDSERVAAIATKIKCPVCAGESVEQSAVEISRQIRIDIANRINAGQTDDDIQDFYREKYGDQILLTPSGSGISALVWALPVVALICAVGGLASVFLRWRRDALAAVTTSADDRALVADALAGVRPESAPDEPETDEPETDEP